MSNNQTLKVQFYSYYFLFQIVQRGLGGLQRSNDIMTNDLAKNRYFGFKSYISYRNHCFGDTITSFDDLADFIDVEVNYEINISSYYYCVGMDGR